MLFRSVPVYSLLLVCVLPIPSAHEAAGATGIRHSPRPRRGGRFINGSGALRGEVVNASLGVIASAAKQSIAAAKDGLLRFARNDGSPPELSWLFEIRIGQRMERAVSVRVGAAVAVVIFVRGVRTLS